MPARAVVLGIAQEPGRFAHLRCRCSWPGRVAGQRWIFGAGLVRVSAQGWSIHALGLAGAAGRGGRLRQLDRPIREHLRPAYLETHRRWVCPPDATPEGPPHAGAGT